MSGPSRSGAGASIVQMRVAQAILPESHALIPRLSKHKSASATRRARTKAVVHRPYTRRMAGGGWCGGNASGKVGPALL